MIKKLHDSDPMAVEHLIAEVYQGMTGIEVAIDIGANHGFHSVRFANLKNIKKAIIIEANPALASNLEKKFKHKRLVTVLDLAVSPTPGEHVTLRISSKYHGRGGIKGSHIWEKIDPKIEFDEVLVNSMMLDEIIEEYAGMKLDFLKMDIEGPEIKILMHAEKFWDMNAITVMENSVHGPAIAGVDGSIWVDFVNKKNYKLVDFNLQGINNASELRGFNHVWLVPAGRLEEFTKRASNSYDRWVKISKFAN